MQRFHPGYEEEDPHYNRPNPSTCRVQVVRSVCDWSHGVLTEQSIQNACKCWAYLHRVCNSLFVDCQMIQEANYFIYIGGSVCLAWHECPDSDVTVWHKRTNSCKQSLQSSNIHAS
jgi:hypothetical protein